jgi:hypothetical protein
MAHFLWLVYGPLSLPASYTKNTREAVVSSSIDSLGLMGALIIINLLYFLLLNGVVEILVFSENVPYDRYCMGPGA